MESNKDIKQLFIQELESDNVSTPSFEATWNAAKRQKTIKQTGYLGSLLSAAAILIIAVLYNPFAPDIQTEVDYEAFAEWQAPTDIWFADAVTQNFDVEFSTELTVPSDELEIIE